MIELNFMRALAEVQTVIIMIMRTSMAKVILVDMEDATDKKKV